MNLFKWKVLCYELFAKKQPLTVVSSNNKKTFLRFVIVSIIAPVKVSMMPSAPTTAVLPPPPATTLRPKIGFSIDSIVGGEGGGDSKRNYNNNNTKTFTSEDCGKLSKSLHRSQQRLSIVENERNGDSPAPSSPDDSYCNSKEEEKCPRDLKSALPNLPYPFPVHHVNNNSIGNPGPIRPIPFPLHPQQRQLPPHLLHPAYSGVNNSIVSGGGSGNSNRDKLVSDSSAVNNRVASSTSSRSPSPSNDSRKSPMPDSPPSSRPGSSASAPETTILPSDLSPSHPNAHHLSALHGSFPPGAPGQRPPQISPSGVPMVGPQGLPPPFGAYPPGVLNFAAAAAAAAHHHPGLPPPPWAQPPHQPHPAATHPLYPWLLARQSRLFPHRFGPGPELSGFLFQPFRKPKRIRTAFTPNQLLRLEHAFEKNHYVVGTERKQLAKNLSLSETQVKVWFQNRRTKHKRTEQEEQSEKKYGNNSSRSDLPSSGSNLSSSATSADSTRNYSEGMSDDDEEIVMDEEYSDEEEMAAMQQHNFHRT